MMTKKEQGWGGKRPNQTGRPIQKGWSKLVKMRFENEEQEKKIMELSPAERVKIIFDFLQEHKK